MSRKISDKITPSLWFHEVNANVDLVVQYYKTIFNDNLREGEIIQLGETPSGNSEMCELEIFGQRYSFICTANQHMPFTDVFSLILHCENQAEIDKYWDYFSEEGEESMCGWCRDKYGLRWQIIPRNMGELLSRTGAVKVMMEQKKIIISQY